eukprot:sb/3473679/
MEASQAYINHDMSSTLEDFEFTPEDVKKSKESEINPYGAAPDGDIPARILYECRAQLSYPLWLLWRRSLDGGTIPATLKNQHIVPLFKKGDRTNPANYRPVSLTSNIIKIFERVMRNQIVQFLEDKKCVPRNSTRIREEEKLLNPTD